MSRSTTAASSWENSWGYTDPVWSLEWTVVNLLEAVLAFPGSNVSLAREVVEAADKGLGDSHGPALVAGARVLSCDEKYSSEAERLIREVLNRCRSPEIPAREGMEYLISIYEPAARISASLARRVIVAAREAASEIDSRIYARARAIAARRSIELLQERDLPVESVLGVYCRLVRLGCVSHLPLAEATREVVTWAQSVGLDFHPEITATKAFAEGLDLAKQTGAACDAEPGTWEALTLWARRSRSRVVGEQLS